MGTGGFVVSGAGRVRSVERRKPLKADPEKTKAWQRRSAEKARARNRERRDRPEPGDAAREALSKANPPRPDPPELVRKPRKERNPGNNPTPPLPSRARCVNCGERAVHQHHLLFRQELRRRRVDAGATESVAPMCWTCHGLVHEGGRKVSLSVFPDAVIGFAVDVLGPYAVDYLDRRYADARTDPRLAGLTNEEE